MVRVCLRPYDDEVAQHGARRPNCRPKHAASPRLALGKFHLNTHIMVHLRLSKRGVRWLLSYDHIAGSGIELIEVTYFCETGLALNMFSRLVIINIKFFSRKGLACPNHRHCKLNKSIFISVATITKGDSFLNKIDFFFGFSSAHQASLGRGVGGEGVRSPRSSINFAKIVKWSQISTRFNLR